MDQRAEAGGHLIQPSIHHRLYRRFAQSLEDIPAGKTGDNRFHSCTQGGGGCAPLIGSGKWIGRIEQLWMKNESPQHSSGGCTCAVIEPAVQHAPAADAGAVGKAEIILFSLGRYIATLS